MALMAEPTVLYTRVLPGGGVVSIECDAADVSEFRAHLKVERRGDPGRRAGHTPPIVLERSGGGADQELIIDELHKVAGDNAAIARHLIAWQAKQRRPQA